jgi:hypothetical protein
MREEREMDERGMREGQESYKRGTSEKRERGPESNERGTRDG